MRSVLLVMAMMAAATAFPSFVKDYTCNDCSPGNTILKEDCYEAKHPGCSWNTDAYRYCHHVGCQKGSSPSPPGPSPPSPPSPTPPSGGHPTFDHQTKDYVVSHQPVDAKVGGFLSGVSVTPFFSPDHSTATVVAFIDGAESTLDIGTPGFSSWSGCTKFSGCVGCSAANQSAEAFPVFQAILNAVHRGVSVRLLTNNYVTSDCDGSISPLPFLLLNKVDVKYYSSTTFYHAKYMSRDGKAASVSSINFSQTSYTKNREAGMLVEGSRDAIKFMTNVFEADWSQATGFKVNQTYSSSDMDIITSKAKRSYNMPEIAKGMAPSPTPAAVKDVKALKVFTSPDYAHETLMAQLTNATKSVEIEIYQVTDDTLCDFISNIHSQENGPIVKLLVSKYIFGPQDHMLATSCYKKLTSAGVTVRMTQDISFYQYCHQKFWIVDGKIVGLSTGNWSPSDYPQGSTFVTYAEDKAKWRSTNRDYTLMVESPDLVKVYQSVMDTDYQAGSDFSSKNLPVMR